MNPPLKETPPFQFAFELNEWCRRQLRAEALLVKARRTADKALEYLAKTQAEYDAATAAPIPRPNGALDNVE